MNEQKDYFSKQQVTARAQGFLLNYLRGFGGQNLLGLKTLTVFHGWEKLAQDRLAEKARSLTDGFDDDVLLAVSKGWIDVREVAAEVVQQLEAGKA